MESLLPHQAILVIDWAMKFVPIQYRETSSDWYGKKGRNWHVGVVITKGEKDTLEVYEHFYQQL